MRQSILCAMLLAALAATPLLHAVDSNDLTDDDDDWRSKYGSKRVQIKIRRADSPTEIYALKRASAQATLDAEQRDCKYREGPGKQYCLRAAEEKFNSTQARLREARDAAAANK